MENSKKRIRLTVAYDGTNYHGWQIQNNGITIESELNRALSELLKEDIQVIGASRTDAGVHSMGNIAVFDTTSRIPAQKFHFAINALLPEDIRVMKSDEVPLDWHPRHQDCRKTYEYRITVGVVQDPTRRLYSHFTYHDVNVDAMQIACPYFVGEHDFAALCAAGSQAETTVRTVYDLSVRWEPAESLRKSAAVVFEPAQNEESPAESTGGDVVIRVTGNGFLYNMVRILAGTLLDVGMGRKKAEDIPSILEGKDRRQAGPTLPARGLRLIGYTYDEKK